MAGAIETVRDQTYDAIEVVVVDGSDDDRTEVVVERSRRRDPEVPITYIHNAEPKGLPAARNQASRETEATYVAFLDDDDRWDPTKIERQVSKFRSGGDDLGLVHSGVNFVESDGSRGGTHRPEYESPPYRLLLAENVISTPSCVMVRRDAFEAIGRFDESMRYCEDWDLYIRLVREYEADYVSDPLVDRVMHDEAMTRDAEEMTEYEERVLRKFEDELRSHGMFDEAWSRQYRRTGRRYLRSEDFSEAATAFRSSWALGGGTQCLLLYLVLVVTPSPVTIPTVDRLSSIKRFVLDSPFAGVGRPEGDATRQRGESE